MTADGDRSLDQRRAAHAFEWLDKVKKKLSSVEQKKHYRSYVDRLGAAVVMNGLGQSLAMERSQAGEGDLHRLLGLGLESWLRHPDSGLFAKDDDVLRRLCDCDQRTYLRAQAEAAAWLTWHKRLCRAEFGSEGTGD